MVSESGLLNAVKHSYPHTTLGFGSEVRQPGSKVHAQSLHQPVRATLAGGGLTFDTEILCIVSGVGTAAWQAETPIRYYSVF